MKKDANDRFSTFSWIPVHLAGVSGQFQGSSSAVHSEITLEIQGQIKVIECTGTVLKLHWLEEKLIAIEKWPTERVEQTVVD